MNGIDDEMRPGSRYAEKLRKRYRYSLFVYFVHPLGFPMHLFLFGLLGYGCYISFDILATICKAGFPIVPGLLSVLFCIVAGLLFLAFIRFLTEYFRYDKFETRIVPYFESEIGRWTYSSGMKLSANCEELDRIAFLMQVKPISYFGFEDDFHNEKLEWHDSEEGIKTFEALRKHCEKEDDPELLAEINEMIEHLETAAHKGVKFTLHIHQGDGKLVSALNFQNRKGVYW